MHDSITFATPFHPKNDLENRPFRASYISTRSQRRLSGKFGHEMGGDRCRGRWIFIMTLFFVEGIGGFFTSDYPATAAAVAAHFMTKFAT